MAAAARVLPSALYSWRSCSHELKHHVTFNPPALPGLSVCFENDWGGGARVSVCADAKFTKFLTKQNSQGAQHGQQAVFNLHI